MPFTLSHSAAVLPFLRSRYFSATGLVVGTMAPDFEYFFRMNIQGIYGHTLLGIFYFDIPVSLMLAILFHGIVKKNLIDNLPYFLQSRFREARTIDFGSYLKDHKLIFILSVILGTITHIVWDGFTHDRQFFVKALPLIYKGRTVDFLGAHYPLWYVLQQVSTLIGLMILAVFVFKMKPQQGQLYKPVAWYWIMLILVIAAITWVRMQSVHGDQWSVILIITIVSAFCIGITILGLVPFRKELKDARE